MTIQTAVPWAKSPKLLAVWRRTTAEACECGVGSALARPRDLNMAIQTCRERPSRALRACCRALRAFKACAPAAHALYPVQNAGLAHGLSGLTGTPGTRFLGPYSP